MDLSVVFTLYIIATSNINLDYFVLKGSLAKWLKLSAGVLEHQILCLPLPGMTF